MYPALPRPRWYVLSESTAPTQPSHNAVVRPLDHWPLRRISSSAAAVHSRLLAQPVGPLRWAASEASRQRAFWWVQLAINEASVRLHVRSRELDQWAASTGEAQAPAALASAGVAHSGAPLWQALATAMHAPVHFVQARFVNSLAVPDDALAWRLPALGWHGVVYASTDAAWEQIIAALPHRPSAGPGEGIMELPLQVSLGVGRVRLNPRDFGRLRRQCVVLLDCAGAVHRHRDLIRLGVTVRGGPTRRLVAHAVWAANALHRVADPVVAYGDEESQSKPESDKSMAEPDRTAETPPPTQIQDGTAQAPSNAGPREQPAPDLSEVEVEVRFEIGRMRWPLRQLVQWRVGQPVPMELELRDTPVTAWVHERCIASGRLVVIGERLGVRLDEVFTPLTKPTSRSNS